jgi:hypothetical protein
MRHLILYSAVNTGGKHDGDEFTREARAYAQFHADRGDGCTLVAIPQLPALQRPAAVERALLEAHREGLGEPFDVLALFSHGTERWIQTGHTLARVQGLAATLARVLSPLPVLWWAACRTAGANPLQARAGELPSGGILQQLVMRLDEHQILAIAWGHTTAGHTSRNPNLALIIRDETIRATNAERFVLQRELWKDDSDLRFRIPLARSIAGLLELARKK